MLRLENLSWTFNQNGVRAVDSVCLNLKPGMIAAILGENGAGKSTLAKICTGRLSKNEGELTGKIFISSEKNSENNGDEKPEELLQITNTAEAIKAGLVLVEQDPKLALELKVWENLVLGFNQNLKIPDLIFFKPKQIIQKLKDELSFYNIDLPLTEKTSSMDLANIYWTAIADALLKNPRYIFFDEATAQFSPQEVKKFYSVLRKYADGGACVIIITHKLQEVLNYADIAFVMNQALLIKTEKITPETNEEDLINAIFENRSLNKITLEKKEFLIQLNKDFPPRQSAESEGLKISNLHLRQLQKSGRVLQAVHLHHKRRNENCALNLIAEKGEITGIIGIKNQGLEILEDILAGLLRPVDGRIFFEGKPLKKLSRNEWGYIPSKRLKRGIAPRQNILTNIISRVRFFLYRHNFYSQKNLQKWQKNSDFDLQKPLSEQVIALSGGMLQRLIFNRELDNPNPKLLICCEPYFGLDQRVSFELFKRLKTLAKKGSTIVILSSDADSAMEICDKIFVLYGGKITLSVRAKNDEAFFATNGTAPLEDRFNRMQILSAMLKMERSDGENVRTE